MERKEFIKISCLSAIGLPLSASLLQSCGTLYYAKASREGDRLIVPLTEFQIDKNGKIKQRDFVLLNVESLQFPVCVYLVEGKYIASLLKCTHRGCELSVGGDMYVCPCHGAEFSNEGKVVTGPAETDLITYQTETDEKNVYVYLS